MSLFHEKPSKILAWLNAKGYSGTFEDALRGYIQPGSSLNPGTIPDHLIDRLQSSGYGGDLQDMLTTMFISSTTKNNRKDAEREFFQDSSKDIFTGGSSGNAIQDTDVNTITDTDGNVIRDTQ